jgi:hypothetical protein
MITYDEMNPVRIRTMKQAKEYIGHHIYYLRSEDIDKSGRGYYFTREAIIKKISGGYFWDENNNPIRYKDILRILIKEKIDHRELLKKYIIRTVNETGGIYQGIDFTKEEDIEIRKLHSEAFDELK